MVSIPDWARFARLHEPQKPSNQLISQYHKQRENEVIKLAEEQGYFLTPDQNYLIQNFYTTGLGVKDGSSRNDDREIDKTERKLSRIKLVKLVGVHMRSLGDVGMCSKLRICVLHNNFLSRFDAIGACKYLMKLDLHSNQITTLPSLSWWTGMKHLKLLHLHDNPIGKIENLQNLSGCSKLMALTLYDTPLSLKKNYRHHVVNSLWALKALDNHVISDEEIIEDADFGGKFSALHRSFVINLCPPSPKGTTFSEEMSLARSVLSQISTIMAHNSPVLIVQRYIRGHLTKKRFKIVQDARIWAAVTIQRKWRHYKNLPNPTNDPVPPPPTSPVFGGPSQNIVDTVKMDYDTYMKHRRPGSTAGSELSIGSQREREPTMMQPDLHPTEEERETPVKSATTEAIRKRKNLFINLTKLETQGTFSMLNDEATSIETALPKDPTYVKRDKHESRRKKKKREESGKKKRIKSIKQFFGPVVFPKSPSPEPFLEVKQYDEEEVPVINFRLRGLKRRLHPVDHMTELLREKREAGFDVREAICVHHRRAAQVPLPSVKKQKLPTNSDRMFSRTQGTMGLACLQAVQKAYDARDKAEKMTAKLERVLNLKEQRDAAKEQIKIYKDDRKNNTIREKEVDKKRILDILEQRELKRMSSLEKSHEHRNKFSTLSRSMQQEITFMSDFNTQNNSVSNALMRHDRQAKHEDIFQVRREFTATNKQIEKEQQHLVKKYLEHRQLMRQTETAMSRAAFDSKMLQDANDRIMQARARVAQLKARRDTVQTYYPLPDTSMHSLPPMQSVQPEELQGFDRWETSISMNTGRVGQHQTSVLQ